MFFDFVNDPKQKSKRLELATSENHSLYLRAYSELIVYLQHLFSYYDSVISESNLEDFLKSDCEWGWLNFLKHIPDNKYDKIVFVTYNYDIWLERILKILKIDFCISGFEQPSGGKIEIVKPHGSISFVPKNYTGTSYSINYNLDFDGIPIEQLELQYDGLDKYDKGAIIPPAGDSSRLESSAPWSHKLRQRATDLALEITQSDEIVLCGISYWYVDRREIDELLINLNQDANFTFINPVPPRDLNAVLTSIFSKYVQQSSSSEIGGILND